MPSVGLFRVTVPFFPITLRRGERRLSSSPIRVHLTKPIALSLLSIRVAAVGRMSRRMDAAPWNNRGLCPYIV